MRFGCGCRCAVVVDVNAIVRFSAMVVSFLSKLLIVTVRVGGLPWVLLVV